MKQEISIQLSSEQLEALKDGGTLTIVISSVNSEQEEQNGVSEVIAQPTETGGSFFSFFQMQRDWLRENGKMRTIYGWNLSTIIGNMRKSCLKPGKILLYFILQDVNHGLYIIHIISNRFTRLPVHFTNIKI
jgi:hypothetical protein